jgi:hypothetical protein
VCGGESRLPGSGETVTDPASSAELFNLTGAHARAACAAAAVAPAVNAPAASPSATAPVLVRTDATAPAYSPASSASPVCLQRLTVAERPSS